jgi:hypothetical protein
MLTAPLSNCEEQIWWRKYSVIYKFHQSAEVPDTAVSGVPGMNIGNPKCLEVEVDQSQHCQ